MACTYCGVVPKGDRLFFHVPLRIVVSRCQDNDRFVYSERGPAIALLEGGRVSCSRECILRNEPDENVVNAFVFTYDLGLDVKLVTQPKKNV